MRVGVSGFVPERLAQARNFAGMTRLALSERLGKSSSSISRWENGDSAPESDALEAMSFVLGFPVAWFLKPSNQGPGSPVFFRTLTSTSSDLRGRAGTKMIWLQEVTAYLSQWLDWPEVCLPAVEVQDHRELDSRAIALIAQQCREMWELGCGPLDNLSMAVESAGVICAKVHQGNTKMDGLSQWCERQQRPFILLADDKRNYFRSRFDLAHELGHIVLHRHITTFELAHLNEIEAQANLFASNLLLPEEAISLELPRYPSLENLLSLKRRWRVSIAAIIYRADRLGLLSEQETLRLRKSYSARGWSKNEPFDDQHDVETVRLLPRALAAVAEAKIKSKESICAELLLPRKNLEEICGTEKGYFSDSAVHSLNPEPKLKQSSSNIVEFRRKG